MTYVITGVPRSGTTVPPRRELSALVLLASRDVQFARQLSLYIKALSAFQKLDPNDELSYYRIAGSKYHVNICHFEEHYGITIVKYMEIRMYHGMALGIPLIRRTLVFRLKWVGGVRTIGLTS